MLDPGVIPLSPIASCRICEMAQSHSFQCVAWGHPEYMREKCCHCNKNWDAICLFHHAGICTKIMDEVVALPKNSGNKPYFPYDQYSSLTTVHISGSISAMKSCLIRACTLSVQPQCSSYIHTYSISTTHMHENKAPFIVSSLTLNPHHLHGCQQFK